MQCWKCKWWLFFKPLPDDTFSCCDAWGEAVKDINLKTGVSPKIQIHGVDDIPCKHKKKGRSICETSKKESFKLHPIREEGEKFLCRVLGLK